MAQITPFKAMRFTEKAGHITELVCPPYDIISEAEREAYLAKNPHNIIRLELPREGADPYAAAGDTLNSWLKSGILACDNEPAFFIYEEEFTALGQRKKIRGLVCRVGLEPFSAGVVLPHEETLSKAKTDRFNLMKATNCNFSSIYSLYFDEGKSIASMLDRQSKDEPEMEFAAADGVIHRVWRICDRPALSDITSAFADKKLYIADGHHRYETALSYMDGVNPSASSVMMTLVDMENEGLVVFPTHRIIRGLDNFSHTSLLESCKEYFEIEHINISDYQEKLDAAQSLGKKAFVAYSGAGAVLLTLKDPAVMDGLLAGTPAYRQLDVNILHTLILERLLGIDKENMANQKNLIYTRDPSEAISEVDRGTADCAFLINPTKVSEIAAVAGAGEKMPQKSTYFYPKLITGHVMNMIAIKDI